MGPKPIYKKNRMVVLKRALPGAMSNTPMLVVKIIKGKKSDGYRHRYEVASNDGGKYYVYESDLG